MASLGKVSQLLKDLKTEHAKPKPDLEKCKISLDLLKIGLLEISYMPTDAQASQQELMIAREVLEIGAEYSVAKQDFQQFERYISQLKCYYYDYKNQIPESQNKYKLLGLNLLFLLSQNRVAEFHTELELLPCEVIKQDKFIQHPLALEQYLMEGRYSKLFEAKANSPAECYNFFIDTLLGTVRNEIAACLEQAYERVSVKAAGKRLYYTNEKEVKIFGEKRKWNLGNDGFYHFSSEKPKEKEAIPSVELAEMAISYARELEMIV